MMAIGNITPPLRNEGVYERSLRLKGHMVSGWKQLGGRAIGEVMARSAPMASPVGGEYGPQVDDVEVADAASPNFVPYAKPTRFVPRILELLRR